MTKRHAPLKLDAEHLRREIVLIEYVRFAEKAVEQAENEKDIRRVGCVDHGKAVAIPYFEAQAKSFEQGG